MTQSFDTFSNIEALKAHAYDMQKNSKYVDLRLWTFGEHTIYIALFFHIQPTMWDGYTARELTKSYLFQNPRL